MKTICVMGFLVVTAISVDGQKALTNSYSQVALVSDIPGAALVTDSHLVNPWGLSRPQSATDPEGQWWAADQGTGVSTLYDANGAIVPLTVTIPTASGKGVGSPTGTNTLGINFVFTTLDGTISEWVAKSAPTPAAFDHKEAAAAQTCTSCHVTTAVIRVNNASKHAVYTGSTVTGASGSQTMFVANANGGVEEYNAQFKPVALAAGAFTDPAIPAGFTPYGIQAVGSRIYVTFAGAGAGGYVDAFDHTGKLVSSLQQGAWFDAPWGIAVAPSNFGGFSKALLVGNEGSGKIAAFNPSTGKFIDFVRNSSGQAIVNPGLWSIYFGAGNSDSGPTNTLYFNAGIQNYAHGLFGAITAN